MRGTPNAPRPSPELLHPDRVPRGPDVVAPDEYAQLVADELVRRGLAYRDSLGELVVGSPTPASTVESGVQRQTATAHHSALNPTSFAELRDNLVTGIRGDFEHGILDQWNMSDEMRRQVDSDEQIDIEERRMLRELNENVDRENEHRRADHLPLLPTVTALTDQQRTTVREQVEAHFREQDQQRQRTQPQPGGAAHPTGGAPTTGGVTTGTGTGAGTGTGTGTQTSDEGRPATWSRFGEQIGMGLAGMAAGVWGIDLPAEHHDAAAATGTGTTTTPATGGATTPAGAPAGAHPGTGTTATTGAAAGAAAGGAAAHPAAHAGHFGDLDDHDVEELVKRVYARLRTSLRNELLTDRERAGMLADFR